MMIIVITADATLNTPSELNRWRLCKVEWFTDTLGPTIRDINSNPDRFRLLENNPVIFF